MSKDDKKAVAKTGAGAVGPVIDYGDDAGAGFENQSRADIAIPFLNLLQDDSKPCKDRQDAKAGMFFNTVTEEVYKSVTLIPAITDHHYVEWIPKKKGGGFVGIHSEDSDIVKKARAASKEFGKYVHNGNDLVETFYIYGVLEDEDGNAGQMVVVPLASTKINAYKRWNTKIKMFQVKLPDGRRISPPMFAHRIRLESIDDSRNGNDFKNLTITPAEGEVASSLLEPSDPRYKAGKDLKEMVQSGVASAAHDSLNEDDNPAAEGGEGSTKKNPF